MNRRLLCIVGFCFACTAFWSCAEGDLFSPDEMDEFAVEKISQLGKDGFDSLMALCKDDSKCRAEMEKYPAPVTSSSKVKEESSSSEDEPQSSVNIVTSSSNEDSSLVTSSTESSGQSSSEASPDSSLSSSSDTSAVESSASPAVSSSSEVPEGSASSSAESSSDEPSSSEDSSAGSSETPASSEPVPVSSSSEEPEPATSSSAESSSSLLPPSGKCLVNGAEMGITTVKIGEPVSFEYIPDEGTSATAFNWVVSGADKVDGDRKSKKYTASYKAANLGGTSVAFRVDNIQVCSGTIVVSDEVYDDPNVPASSNDDTPEQSATSSTPPTSGSNTPGVTTNSSGSTPGVTTNSSASNPGVTTSSSGGSNTGTVTELYNFNPKTGQSTFSPGTYRVMSVSGGKDSFVCNVDVVGGQLLKEVFTFPNESDCGTGDAFWNTGATITVRPSLTFTFTTGQVVFRVNECWP